MSLENKALRFAILGCNWMVWISAVIVMALLSYFISRFHGRRSEHIVYDEVIATMTVAVYIPALVLPLLRRYRGFYFPVHFIFAFLWLTAFIFAAQDWNWHACARIAPFGRNLCPKKHATEAFIFLAFFFITCNVILETMFYHTRTAAARGVSNGFKEKHAAGASPADGAGAPTATSAAPAETTTAPAAEPVAA